MSIPRPIQDFIDAQCGNNARDDWDLSQPDHPNPEYRR